MANRVAVVTGAGNGQGKAMAERLCEEGINVIAVDIDCRNITNLDGITPCEVDISDADACKELSQLIKDKFRRVDILYNNAAVYLPGRGDGPVHQLDWEAFERTFSVNLDGLYHVTREVIPFMKAQQSGVIVNVASTGAVLGSMNHAYAATKGALISLTHSMAVTYGPVGIRVICLSPGMVNTNMTRHLTEDPQQYNYHIQRIPSRRFAEPADIVDVAAFLVSDEARYINGANVIVDGGLVIS